MSRVGIFWQGKDRSPLYMLLTTFQSHINLFCSSVGIFERGQDSWGCFIICKNLTEFVIKINKLQFDGPEALGWNASSTASLGLPWSPHTSTSRFPGTSSNLPKSLTIGTRYYCLGFSTGIDCQTLATNLSITTLHQHYSTRLRGLDALKSIASGVI